MCAILSDLLNTGVDVLLIDLAQGLVVLLGEVVLGLAPPFAPDLLHVCGFNHPNLLYNIQ